MLRDLFSLFPAHAGVIHLLSNIVANGLNFSPHMRG